MPPKASRAKRALFGLPTAEDDRPMAELAEQLRDEKCQKWAFDCRHGAPMPSSSAEAAGLHYEKVDAKSVPQAYRAVVCRSSARPRPHVNRPVSFGVLGESASSSSLEEAQPDAAQVPEPAKSSAGPENDHLSGVKLYRTPKKTVRHEKRFAEAGGSPLKRRHRDDETTPRKRSDTGSPMKKQRRCEASSSGIGTSSLRRSRRVVP